MMKRYVGSAFRRINQITINKKRRIYNESYPELREILSKYSNSFHKDGGFQYPSQDLKVMHLMDVLVEKKAKNIIEYGTGATSLACAYYATHYDANYLGLDESDKWAKLNYERVEEFIPDVVNSRILHAPRIDDYSEDIYFTSVDYHPDSHFDFMLIDGPSFNLDEDHKFKVNDDLTKYLEKGLPETIVVDNRKTTVKWLKTYLKDTHTCRESAYWNIKKKILRVDTFTYLSIFEKIKS